MPAGLQISSETTSGAFWWKAFNFFIEGDAYIAEEVKYIFRELYAWHETRAMIKGNSPFFHHRRGKLMLLSAASQFFPIPRTQVGWRLPRATNSSETVIAKSLTSGLITSDKAMYATEVRAEQLDPRFPWYLQEKIEADSDVTIQLCGHRAFSFKRSRDGLQGVDWRKEIFREEYNRAPWEPFPLTQAQQAAVMGFAKAIDVDWGRLDLLERDGQLTFLEFNANGQWVFLDEDDKHGLVTAIEAYLLQNQ